MPRRSSTSSTSTKNKRLTRYASQPLQFEPRSFDELPFHRSLERNHLAGQHVDVRRHCVIAVRDDLDVMTAGKPSGCDVGVNSPTVPTSCPSTITRASDGVTSKLRPPVFACADCGAFC